MPFFRSLLFVVALGLLQDIARRPGLMLDDGIHPTAEAQRIILDTVWESLEPLL